ncbi:MAG: MgtC/SapB family protein [Actinomycetota bacterium]
MLVELAAEAAPQLTTVDLVGRVLGSAVLGGLVGLERELKSRPAGFRTHILVSLGACLFTMAGAYGARAFYGVEGAADVDPTRVAAQVVAGIGFLGAGAIIRTGANVQGLTTAAALWVTAAIGLAVGLGFWLGAAAVAGVTVTALYGLKWLEQGPMKRLGKDRFQFVVDADSALTLSDLAKAIERCRGHIEMLHLDADDAGTRRIQLVVRLRRGTDPGDVSKALLAVEGVSSVDWSH